MSYLARKVRGWGGGQGLLLASALGCAYVQLTGQLTSKLIGSAERGELREEGIQVDMWTLAHPSPAQPQPTARSPATLRPRLLAITT